MGNMTSIALINMKHAYLQIDGTYAFPNSREGDILKQAKIEIEAAEQKLKEISELSREWNDGKAAYDKYPVACWCADELQAIIGSKVMTEPTEEPRKRYGEYEQVNGCTANRLMDELEAAELDLLEANANLSAEQRVSYTFKEALDEAEATIKSMCRVVDRMVNDGIQKDDGVRLRGILLKAIIGNKS